MVLEQFVVNVGAACCARVPRAIVVTFFAGPADVQHFKVITSGKPSNRGPSK